MSRGFFENCEVPIDWFQRRAAKNETNKNDDFTWLLFCLGWNSLFDKWWPHRDWSWKLFTWKNGSFLLWKRKKNVLMPRSLNLHGELFELLVNLAVNVVQLLPFCYCYTSYFFFLFLLVMCYGCVLVFLVVRKTLSKCQRVTNWI